MKNNVSLEYAEALFILSCEEGIEQECLAQLGVIKEILANEGYLVLLLSSPNIDKEEKLGVVDAVFGGIACEHIVSLLKLLCEKGRAELIPLVLENYEALYNQVKRVVCAKVTSAVELCEGEKASIIAKLEKKLGQRVALECVVDPQILGGAIIETENTVIDGSLRRKIQEVKEVIKGEPKT